jgi:hypothetical protein
MTPPFRTMIAASPDYVALKGRPKTIADLERHVLMVRSTDRCNTLTFRQEVECYGTTSKASLLYCG